jgi:hypothetical protein
MIVNASAPATDKRDSGLIESGFSRIGHGRPVLHATAGSEN